MSRKNIKVLIGCGTGLSIAGFAFILLLDLSRVFGGSHWSQVPPPELYVTAKPKQEDVAGSYQLIRQTITKNGLAVLQGRMCELNLHLDGSFTLTNYPHWTESNSDAAPTCTLVSRTGRWHCDNSHISYRGNGCWDVELSDVDVLALSSNGAPYDLMLTYGDGDDGTFMLFRKKH